VVSNAGTYYAALQSLLLEGTSLVSLWPIILHDWFHSSGKTRHWVRKHLRGPQYKYLRMLLILISRAYNMFAHPRLYPFIGTPAPSLHIAQAHMRRKGAALDSAFRTPLENAHVAEGYRVGSECAGRFGVQRSGPRATPASAHAHASAPRQGRTRCWRRC
jgi:hypothetical protein